MLVAAVASLIGLGIELYVFAVAYPLFALIGEREFAAVHALHSSRITYIVGPTIAFAFGANALLAAVPAGGVPVWLPRLAAAAGAAVLLITAMLQVPLHARLSQFGRDTAAIARLNSNEPWRALAMTLQAACDVAMVWLVLPRP